MYNVRGWDCSEKHRRALGALATAIRICTTPHTQGLRPASKIKSKSLTYLWAIAPLPAFRA